MTVALTTCIKQTW